MKHKDHEIVDPNLKNVLERIGKQIKALRKSYGNRNYVSFAKEDVGINRNTYLRIENGTGDYTIGNLIKIMSQYPNEKLSDILRKAGL